MRLPKDILSGNYIKPRIFLCEANKEIIAPLETTNTKGTFKFNSYSELSFEVGRTYNDIITGEQKVNNCYDKIEALRLVYLEDIGYFEIQEAPLTGDGIKEIKSVTAYSYEYSLSQKYLEDFYINTGEVNSVEVIEAPYDQNNRKNNIVPVTLYNPSNPKLSLLHLILEKDYAGWQIVHVDPQLQTLSRQFEVDRQSIYDFLINEVCKKFNCYIVFDTINNGISVYAESPTAKIIGDGATKVFEIPNYLFSKIKTVSIDGYKTTKWEYSIEGGTGFISLVDIPSKGSVIEVVGDDTTWDTDVYITFDNLSQEINVDYDADDIKTVLTVTFGDDNDIREVNLGLPYIVDLSYYTTPEWMGQDLYDAWTSYQEKCNSHMLEYTKNTQDILYYSDKIDYEENRVSLGYAEVSVDENTVGTYYVRGGTYPNYYYTEVSLPSGYKANTQYYSTKTTNLEDTGSGNVAKLYAALKKYFMNAEDWKEDLDELSEEFDFINDNFVTDLSSTLAKVTGDRTSSVVAENAIHSFFITIWEELGRTSLNDMFYEPYKKVQATNIDAGWSEKTHSEYGNYYAVVLLVNSIEAAMRERANTISKYENECEPIKKKNEDISNDLLLAKNFTKEQLLRLNAFLREDELHLDDIITTSQDSILDTFKNQQDALESARIELEKISKPQLQFSMTMANIYALPEFEPIIDQFQLGNMIRVGLRSDYIKQSRLMQVNINFDDFSDFSCEFSELTNLRNQSDIHADLLKNAISAGKSVAQNASYWTKGADKATSTDLKIQQGLLDANTRICSIDGTQDAVIDKYGIKLQKKKDNGEVEPKQAWFVNNNLLFTSDGWKTTRMGIGEFNVDVDGDGEPENLYGVIADAVIAGYVEGSHIKGGTIKIGEFYEDNKRKYRFEVDESGHVVLNAASISGYVTDKSMSSAIEENNSQVLDEVEEKLGGYPTTIEVNSAIEQKADSITSEVSKTYATLNHVVHYGTCDTESDVSVKEVACDNFKLYKGASISIKFKYKNSIGRPQLLIDNYLRYIVTDNDEALAYNSSYNWDDNSTVTFIYDGSYWKIADSSTMKRTVTLSTRIAQTEEDIQLEAKRAIDAEDDLSSRITINANAITSKVSNGEFGTLIEQNYDHVKIAWNKNSNYIQFEDGAMNIYTSSSHSKDTLLMKNNYNGAWYYHKGTTIGKIGVNNFKNEPDFKGLVFDLENDAEYMSWSHRENDDDDVYTAQFIYYSRDNNHGKKGIHFLCKSYCENNLYLNDNVRTFKYSDGDAGLIAENKKNLWLRSASYTNNVGICIEADRSATDPVSTRFSVFPNKFEFGNSSSLLLDCYNNIDLHGYDVLNQCDARLKTNIQDTQVSAIDLISQIEMKEFDWIEDGTHEDIGIIAQQLQTIMPSLVSEGETGRLSVKFIKLIPYLIKSIQELTDYITGDASTFNRRVRWEDNYTDDDKRKFTELNLSKKNIANNKKEAKVEKIYIPINSQQGDDTNE